MKTKFFTLLMILGLCVLNVGMARKGQYDEESRAQEREAKRIAKTTKVAKNPLAGIASGVKQATVDSTVGLLSDTAKGTGHDPILIKNIQGAREGSGRAIDNVVKGAFKVATLGFGEAETVRVREPEKNTDDTTKFTITIPGT